MTVSIAVGAALIGVTGYRPLLGAIASVSVLAAGYLLSRPRTRHPHPTDQLPVSVSPGY